MPDITAAVPPGVAPAVPTVPSWWRFPAHPASVGRARSVVAEALPYDVRGQLGADLGLLTSELVTNSIRHGAREEYGEVVEIVLWPADGHYWVAVSDPGMGKPELVCPGAADEGGRGLVLVDALSSTWAVLRRPACGKTVVAGLRLHGR